MSENDKSTATDIAVVQAGHVIMVSDDLGYVCKPVTCMMRELDDEPCDSAPDFKLIDQRCHVDPGAIYCLRHVKMAVRAIRVNRALGLGGAQPFYAHNYRVDPPGSQIR